MHHSADVVTTGRATRPELPSHVREGVVVALALQRNGTLDLVSGGLKLDRKGGYAGIDVFLFLLFYFASRSQSGLNHFYITCLGWTQRMAGVVGRMSMSSGSAASRMLACVAPPVLRTLTHRLLRDGCGAASILRHPSVTFTDAERQHWHVFDYDGTRDVMRQRALPEGDDLPPPVRLSDRVATAGYPGRKRGEVQVHRSALQHAGTGLWLDTRLAPGNGERRAELASALQAVVATCSAIEHPLDRVLVREDGEFGDVPSLTAHREAGVACVTRLNRLLLLDQADVRRRMQEGSWFLVPDSRSGPTRSAFDLGIVGLRPGKEVLRDDGSPYDPIDVRVIITRRPQSGKADHGRVIEGWQYEVFAALDLDAHAWPAAEVIALYFGRAGQENRFAQEDREIGLDRLHSYSLGGQELVSVVGLLVWNLRIVHGFHLNPPPSERRAPPPRSSDLDPRPVLFPLDAPEEESPDTPIAPTQEGAFQSQPGPPQIEHDLSHIATADESLRNVLNELEWEHLLRRHHGWAHEPCSGMPVCPADHSAPLTTVASRPRGQPTLMFRVPARACASCPQRGDCFASVRTDASKMIACAVPVEKAEHIKELLARAHHERRRSRSQEALSADPPAGRLRRPLRGEPLPLREPGAATPPGAWSIDAAHLNPAAARRAWEEAIRSIQIQVHRECPEAQRPHPYLVDSPARRQRRRATWSERVARYALPQEARVKVRIENGHQIGKLLGWAREDQHQAA